MLRWKCGTDFPTRGDPGKWGLADLANNSGRVGSALWINLGKLMRFSEYMELVL